MNSAKALPGKVKMFALVRDSDGNPVFDDYQNIPPEIAHALTETDLKFIEGKLK